MPDPPPLRRDPAWWALAAAAVLHLLWTAPRLVYPDLNLAYPFLGGDSLDWIANGLARAGWPVRDTVRPPLVPLALAGLERLGLLAWFPVVNQLAWTAGGLVLYRTVRPAAGAVPALAVGLAALFGHAALVATLDVMADAAASVLLFGSAAAFLAAGERPGRYPWAGLLAGLSALAQQAALLLPLPGLLVVGRHRREHLRDRRLWLGAALFAAGPAAWFVAKRLRHGTAGDVVTQHWGLLGAQLDGVPYYAAAAAALWGLPALAAAAAGAVVLLRRGDERGTLWTSVVVVLAGFVVFFYDYRAGRLLLYAYLPALALAAHGLAALRGRIARGAAAAAVALWAVWPRPAGGPEATRATLWPLPPVVLELAPERGLEVRTVPVSRALAGSAWGRVAAARRRAPEVEPIDPALFAGDRSAVYLQDPASPVEERYRVLYRLGNALRLRVKVVPRTLYPEGWWGFDDAEPIARVDEYALFRVALPGIDGTTVLALPRRDPLAGRLGRDGGRQRPAPPEAALAAALARARAAAGAVEGPDGFLAVFERAGPDPLWVRLLPFVATTSSLFVVPPADAPDLLAAVEAGPVYRRRRAAGLEMVTTRVRGFRVTVVLPPAAHRPDPAAPGR